ncbi:LytTR family two component transcriptional regulator [Mucilaginibacter frigoritolerans]|jgi:two-component system, LytTR family, response regulator|uniref:LytTR family two component transcriptional regulator n=1 Tax=Mucilaginibacter frigoritolerans TaxID=652788 RepID=A0A562U9A3_9SPHI|nr:LytTR family DNA-binding domain-containing protein [Mucilaginibacter frigoritolerans]TWJ02413.1 LytTR family two component transcriptional regulator [Mucilaginibacter frigoritolerans]
MQLKCIAIDDEPLAIEIIKRHISEFPDLKLIQTFEDAISGAEFLKNQKVDLIFIDIDMPDITGIDLVRSLSDKPMVVFTTAYKKFAFEGFELEAIDYLLKPISIERFSAAVQKVLDYAKYKNAESREETDASIYVHSEYRMIKIDLKEIQYIESMQDYVKIYLSNIEKPVLTLMSMKGILEKLPPSDFVRIHRSFAVAKKQVLSIHNRKVKLKTAELPVGNNYADFIKEWSK